MWCCGSLGDHRAGGEPGRTVRTHDWARPIPRRPGSVTAVPAERADYRLHPAGGPLCSSTEGLETTCRRHDRTTLKCHRPRRGPTLHTLTRHSWPTFPTPRPPRGIPQAAPPRRAGTGRTGRRPGENLSGELPAPDRPVRRPTPRTDDDDPLPAPCAGLAAERLPVIRSVAEQEPPPAGRLCAPLSADPRPG